MPDNMQPMLVTIQGLQVELQKARNIVAAQGRTIDALTARVEALEADAKRRKGGRPRKVVEVPVEGVVA